MTKIISVTLMTVLFSFAILQGLHAQERYDFTMVYIYDTKIHVIQNGMQAKIVETGNKYMDHAGLNEKLISQVSDLTSDGWEVLNASPSTTVVTTSVFYLKRKKK